jgi:L-amino acid N-acyltransferase YncA
MNNIHYRDATLEDLKRIIEIYNTTVASRIVTADTEPVSVESRVRWFNEHTPERRPLWVMEDDQHRIMGWVSFQSFYGRPAYNGTTEISIYLDPAIRGQGVGKRALQYAMDNCGRFGIKTLLGFIFTHNEPSIKLFQHFGFKEWANLPNIAELDGIERSLIILGKRVNV